MCAATRQAPSPQTAHKPDKLFSSNSYFLPSLRTHLLILKLTAGSVGEPGPKCSMKCGPSIQRGRSPAQGESSCTSAPKRLRLPHSSRFSTSGYLERRRNRFPLNLFHNRPQKVFPIL